MVSYILTNNIYFKKLFIIYLKGSLCFFYILIQYLDIKLKTKNILSFLLIYSLYFLLEYHLLILIFHLGVYAFIFIEN